MTDVRLARARDGRARAVVMLVALAIGVSACSDSTAPANAEHELEFDFSRGYQGWVANFADYPVGMEAEWGLLHTHAALPEPLDRSRKALLLTGNNHSDDLFMYLTRELGNLAPGRSYAIRYRVTLATNAPKGCVGVGGAPGESVVLKVGAVSLAPTRSVDALQHYRTNFDHGQQTVGGSHALPIGDLANSNTNCLQARYELKQYDSGSTPLTVAADGTGRIWLILGIDSGFEGLMAVYVVSVRAEVLPVS